MSCGLLCQAYWKCQMPEVAECLGLGSGKLGAQQAWRSHSFPLNPVCPGPAAPSSASLVVFLSLKTRAQRIDIPWLVSGLLKEPQDTGHLFLSSRSRCREAAARGNHEHQGRCGVSLLGESEWCRPGVLADSPRFLWLPRFGWGRGGGGRESRVSLCLPRVDSLCHTGAKNKTKLN